MSNTKRRVTMIEQDRLVWRTHWYWYWIRGNNRPRDSAQTRSDGYGKLNLGLKQQGPPSTSLPPALYTLVWSGLVNQVTGRPYKGLACIIYVFLVFTSKCWQVELLCWWDHWDQSGARTKFSTDIMVSSRRFCKFWRFSNSQQILYLGE